MSEVLRPTVTARPGLVRAWFWATALGVLVLDLWSKAWAFALVLENRGELRILGPYLRLVRAENTGTIWGLGQGHTTLLILLRVAMVLLLSYLAWRVRGPGRVKLAALGLVVGGALGNLYDNLFRETRGVRDFIDVWIPLPWREELWHYPTFNLADASILCGAILLFFAFGEERSKGEG